MVDCAVIRSGAVRWMLAARSFCWPVLRTREKPHGRQSKERSPAPGLKKTGLLFFLNGSPGVLSLKSPLQRVDVQSRSLDRASIKVFPGYVGLAQAIPNALDPATLTNLLGFMKEPVEDTGYQPLGSVPPGVG